MKAFLLLVFVFVAGCTSSPRFEEHNALIRQILSPRAGYKTLTNQVIRCDKEGKCAPHVLEYDLNDVQVRKTLQELSFRCDVGGKLYYICRDGPGLCRREYDKITKFLGIVVKREAVFAPVIDINDRYQFLIDAGTRCESAKLSQD